MFERNESAVDRIIRAIVGIVLVALWLTTVKGAAGIVLLVVGIILIITAITGFCLLYKLFGFSTAKK